MQCDDIVVQPHYASMEQFSHDLTLALEETSRSGGIRPGKWGFRRRTRSTGNLPCAPLPTEDSSSSPAEQCSGYNAHQNTAEEGHNNSLHSDSDDKNEIPLMQRARQSSVFGNFESDSLNENFSPARPNTRRKRKFKRMAVEYETTTPSTPGTAHPSGSFPGTGAPTAAAVKKRVLKHTCQENFRANIFFCGKRKRSHRDRYCDASDKQLHSSSVPRQRDFLANPKCTSYLEYRNHRKTFAIKPCERIMPLNKSIVSKIEKISLESSSRTKVAGFQFGGASANSASSVHNDGKFVGVLRSQEEHESPFAPAVVEQKMLTHKSGSFESTFGYEDLVGTKLAKTSMEMCGIQGPASMILNISNPPPVLRLTKEHSQTMRKCGGGGSNGGGTNKQRLSKELRAQLQFDDPNGMECGHAFNDALLSSSSLSSSDSDEVETNESDGEGDDELTDWPGNEAMVNFASKHDFKRAKARAKVSTLPQIKSDDVIGDDDTLMSGDDMFSPSGSGGACGFQVGGGPSSSGAQSSFLCNVPLMPPSSLNLSLKFTPSTTATMPINIMSTTVAGTSGCTLSGIGAFNDRMRTQIESEMSGETSNHFLSSPTVGTEIREIRAGCRRVHTERPGFTIVTRANEHLAKFLQDPRQTQLIIPDIEASEGEQLLHLAKLYSLTMRIENRCAAFTKTSKTTQTVRIDQTKMMSSRFLSDYKRRCYDGSIAADESEVNEMGS